MCKGDDMSEVPDETTEGEETQEQDGPEPQSEPTPDEEEAAEEESEPAEEGPVESMATRAADGATSEPEQPQAMSEKDIEAAFRKLDREADRHRKRVSEIMGDEFGVLLACPLCDAVNPGYVLPTPDVPQRFPAVREFMGDSQPRELKHDQNISRCQVCDGWGTVESGSRVQGQTELACTECGGKGWLGQRAGLATLPLGVPLPVGNGLQDVTVSEAGGDSPEVAALKAQGYIVLDPPAKATT
jgi:hypothetical protein